MLIFKNEVGSESSSGYLASFEYLLKNKPDNTWLIRESRLPGRISVTYKKKDHIIHQRYAFVPRRVLGVKLSGGSWELNNDPDRPFK